MSRLKHYYNDSDRRCAAWLKWLIANDQIPYGDVDDRSIRDVQPGDLDGYVQCHFFAGCGGWPLAALLAGYPPGRPLWSGSCPCQPFSAAGERKGADDDRHLWPDLFRLVRACRPPRLIGEQVSGALGQNWFAGVRADLGGAAYWVRATAGPAAAAGSPQIRERIYFAAVDSTDGSRLAISEARGLHDRGESGFVLDRPDGPQAVASPAGEGPNGLRARRSRDRARGGRPGHGHGLELAGGSGVRRERRDDLEVGRSEGRTAAAGHDAGEQPRALGGTESLGPQAAGREPGAGPAPAQSERSAGSLSLGSSASKRRRSRPQEPGQVRDWRAIADASRSDVERAAGWGLEEWEQSGRFGGLTGRWAYAARANDRDLSWWDGADWIVCHDEKARRIPHSDFPMLASGFPGRVAGWSGMGNAICVPYAQAWVESLLEIEAEAEGVVTA